MLSAEAYAKVETDFINQLFDLVNSAYAHEKLGAILAIEEIIEVRSGSYSFAVCCIDYRRSSHGCFESASLVILLGHLTDGHLSARAPRMLVALLSLLRVSILQTTFACASNRSTIHPYVLHIIFG